jgi:hypothetical protein
VAVRFAAEHIDLILPNSANDFFAHAHFGRHVPAYGLARDRHRLLRNFSAGFECSSTVSISGTHDLLGSKPKDAR